MRPAASILQRQLEQMGMHVPPRKTTDGSARRQPRHRRRVRGRRDARRAIWWWSPRASGRTSSSRSAPGCEVDRGIVVGDDLACRGRAGRLRGRRVRRSIAAASTVWSRRCGSRRSVLADRLTGRNRDAVYVGSQHVHEAEGRGRRPRGDGRQGAGRGRRRGGQLCGAVARHLQEADRPQQPPGRRHRHGRRRDRARRCSRRFGESDAARATTAPSCSSRLVDRDPRRRAPERDPGRPRRSATATRSARREIIEAVLGGARSVAGGLRRRPAPAPAAASCRPRGRRRSSQLACQGLAAGAARIARRPPAAIAVGAADRRRGRRHAEQDRTLQEGKRRTRHPRRGAANRAGGMGRRSRTATASG